MQWKFYDVFAFSVFLFQVSLFQAPRERREGECPPRFRPHALSFARVSRSLEHFKFDRIGLDHELKFYTSCSDTEWKCFFLDRTNMAQAFILK